MSSMYNAISTSVNEDTPRRIPWRLGLALGCLVLALGFGAIAYQHAVTDLGAARRSTYLAVAGPIAEFVEQQRQLDDDYNPQDVTDTVAPLFKSEKALAAVRIWDSANLLVNEVTRLHPDRTITDPARALPDLGLKNDVRILAPQLRDTRWTDPVAHLQLVESEEEMFAQEAEAAKNSLTELNVRQTFYLRQDTIRQIVQDIPGMAKPMAPTMKAINVVLDTLTQEDTEVLARLPEQVDDVQAALTAVFTDYRAIITGMPMLPHTLSAAAPPPSCWQEQLLPCVTPRRVVVPIFTPSMNDQLVEHVGYVDVMFYARQGEVLTMLDWRWGAPSIAFLLLALVTLIWPRRRKVVTLENAQAGVSR